MNRPHREFITSPARVPMRRRDRLARFCRDLGTLSCSFWLAVVVGLAGVLFGVGVVLPALVGR